MHNMLHGRYYKIKMKERYLVQTHLETKSSGIKSPEFHGVKKTLDTNLLPNKTESYSTN